MMSATRFLTETSWPGEIHLILGFRAPRDFIFREEIARLESCNPKLHVTVVMSRPADEPWPGRRGRIDAALLGSAVPQIAAQRIHICGPPSMMEAVKTALLTLGVPEPQIRTEAFGTVKRDPTARRSASAGIAGKVLFQTSDITAPVAEGETILDAADQAGVFIDSACRSGTCGSCRIRLLAGNVSMDVEDALSAEDKATGDILACQAHVRGDVKVDA
jgi:ferredoxin-NADP reductase